MPRFFDAAPILPWSTWLKRKMLSYETIAPKILYPSNTDVPLSPTGVPYKVCSSKQATEYSAFLELHYCPKKESVKLRIPSDHLQVEMEMATLIGVEVRTDTHELVGLVWSRLLGHIDSEPTRLITWFCVHPNWRKRGLADYLLYAIRQASSPTHIFWFRNDGLPKSLIPPVWTQKQIVRTIKGSRSLRLLRMSHEAIQEKCMEYWKRKNPTGICIDPKGVPPILEWYSIQTKLSGAEYSYAVLVANLFEYRQTESTCEIVDWFPLQKEAPKDIERFILDEIVSLLPYNRVEAPEAMPHIESLWNPSLPTSWFVYGYDVGTPVIRPILSLTFA